MRAYGKNKIADIIMTQSEGSALLIVMAMAILVQMVIFHAWFVAGLYGDLAHQRTVNQQNFYQAEAIFDASLLFIQQHFDALYKKTSDATTPLSFDMSRLMHCWFASTISRSMIISLRRVNDAQHTNALTCSAQLYEHGIPICSLRCMLTKMYRTTAQAKEKHCVVSHWTFGIDV
jgi:hypothetical protein